MFRAVRGAHVATAALAAFALARVAAACVDLDSLGNGKPEGGADASEEADAPVIVDPCGHARPAVAPETDDDPDGGLPDFVLALDQAILDPVAAPGFDLDGKCTCDTRLGAPSESSCTVRAEQPICDVGEGVDNQIAAIAQATQTSTDFDQIPNRLMMDGRRTLLLQISGYNGRANDRSVNIGAVLAEGIRAQGCADAAATGDGSTWTPCRTGNDTWTASSESATVGSRLQPAVSGEATVRDYRLTVRYANSTLILPLTADAAISVYSAVISAKLVPLDENLQPRDGNVPPTAAQARFFRLEEGLIAGRVPIDSAVNAVGTITVAGKRLCATSGLMETVRNNFCLGADLRVAPPFDPSAACDGLSIGIGFRAIPALYADASAPAPPRPADCVPFDTKCPN